jgi:Zn-dependent membrane protease YugP
MNMAFIIFDPIWFVFLIPGLLIGLYAQMKLKGTYGKYVKVGARSGITGAQAAREILDSAGLNGMPVREVQGHLTDHYDPMKKALFLSSENYHGRSLAALGVAAHEAGHALQHKAAYGFFQLRMLMVPATQFSSAAYGPILFLGFFMGQQIFQTLLSIAIGLFAVITFFQLVTLPVEYDASRRAKVQLDQLGLISRDEAPAVRKVLNAAALTYVAAMVSALLQLAYLMLLRNRD